MPIDPKYKDTMRLTLNTKRTSDSHPHYKGHGNHAGVEFWASAWVNKNDDGSTWLKLSTETKEQQSLSKMVAEELGNDPLAAVASAPAKQPEQMEVAEYVPSYEREQPAQGLKTPASTHAKVEEQDDVPF